MAEDGANDLSLIDKTRNEKRAQRPVDEPRDQRLLFRRAPLAFEKASGDLSGCKRLLLVINREREEVLTGLCRFHRDRSAQNRGLAVGGEHGAVRLAGEPPSLQDEGSSAPHQLLTVNLEHSRSSSSKEKCRAAAQFQRRAVAKAETRAIGVDPCGRFSCHTWPRSRLDQNG